MKMLLGNVEVLRKNWDIYFPSSFGKVLPTLIVFIIKKSHILIDEVHEQTKINFVIILQEENLDFGKWYTLLIYFVSF